MFRPLKKPPKGMRWELRVDRFRYKDMHLVDKDGHSYGSFMAFDRDGNPTDYWRFASTRVIRDYKRSRKFEYLPELAGYRIQKD